MAIGWLLAVGPCVLVSAARAQGTAETDRAALVALYHATGGPGWTHDTNWLEDEPLKDWYGVEVNGYGRVTHLRLGGWDESLQKHVGNGLTGSLPPDLGTLSHLRGLEIGGNSGLTGPIPAALGNLVRLVDLDLQANRLTGSMPAALGRLSNLERLLLGSNPLGGHVPPEFGNLTRLRDLELRYTMLSGPLPENFARLPTVDWLALEGSGLCVPDTPAMAGMGGRGPGFQWSLLRRIGGLLARRLAARNRRLR